MKDKRQALTILTASVVLVGSCGSMLYPVIRDRVEMAQEQQARAEKMPYGASGRDIRRPTRALDEMYAYVGIRAEQEVSDPSFQRLPRPEKVKRIDAVFKAMQDEIKRVTDSHYTKPFDKNAIEREYQQILWVDRLRSQAPILVSVLLLAVAGGAAAFAAVRRRTQKSVKI